MLRVAMVVPDAVPDVVADVVIRLLSNCALL